MMDQYIPKYFLNILVFVFSFFFVFVKKMKISKITQKYKLLYYILYFFDYHNYMIASYNQFILILAGILTTVNALKTCNAPNFLYSLSIPQ